MHRIRAQGRNRRTIYIERTCLFVSSKTAAIVNPAAQMASSTALPKAWSAAPASTEAIGVIPCEPTLTRLLTQTSAFRRHMHHIQNHIGAFELFQ